MSAGGEGSRAYLRVSTDEQDLGHRETVVAGGYAMYCATLIRQTTKLLTI